MYKLKFFTKLSLYYNIILYNKFITKQHIKHKRRYKIKSLWKAAQRQFISPIAHMD